MEPDLEKIYDESFVEKVKCLKLIEYQGVRLFEDYHKIKDAVENFEVRDDDVWVCSFPKTGTTWTQEMVWCIANDLNYDAAKKSALHERFLTIDFAGNSSVGCLMSRRSNFGSKEIARASRWPSPRFIRSHLPFHLLPRELRNGEKRAKIIYVSRNAKDTCISNYHDFQEKHGFTGTFENFCKLFLGNELLLMPFWNHVIGFWEENKRQNENILSLKFEDMKADLSLVIEKVAKFLNKSFTNAEVKILTDHLDFNNMKSNPAVNYEKVYQWIHKEIYGDENYDGKFIRKGTIGQWKECMTDHMIDKFNEYTENNLKNHPDLSAEFLHY